MATSPTRILAYTSEDDRYAADRRAAEETAAAAEAALILNDIDAAQMFASPLPTEWSGEGDEDQFGDLLTPEDLERAGRHQVARQVAEARAAGIDAYGWLPSKKGADGLAEYADRQEVDLIMLPADLEDPGLFDRLRGATVDAALKETDRPIAVVDEHGQVSYPAHETAPHT
jgi:hypothetical protein